MRRLVSLFASAALLTVLPAAAAGLSKNPHPPTATAGGTAPEVVGPMSITQSTNLTPVSANSVSCNAGGIHTDNSYWRAFTLSSFPALDSTYFVVNSVDIGIEQAVAGSGGSQPAVLRLYTNSGAAFPNGTLTLVSTTNVTVADQNLTLLNIPLAASVPLVNATDTLVVEFFTPNGQTAGHSLFIGSNSAGQAAPGYISAADCSIPTPTATGDIGFATMHIIMQVNGVNQTTPVSLQRVTIE